ncbi:MAG: GIY-YIG nuclease family protein [Prolixibacteraceae bacterium]|nr:GIY-YIG nuclease family protein [Prolixibacteraceae bacterium]
MKFFIYILGSEVDQSFYIGQTGNLIERVKSHNKGSNKSTKYKKPWKLIYSESLNSRSEAYKLEQKLKKAEKKGFCFKIH